MTTPVFEILPREGRTPEEVKLLSDFSLLIDEFINFGTHILKWEIESETGGDENIPVVMMLRHILELGDSVSMLVKSSSVDPSKLLLRGMLETFLGLEYLLDKDTHNRAMAFLVWHFHQKIKILQKFDPNEQSSKNLSQKIKKDKSTSGGFALPLIPDIENKIRDLQTLLSSLEYITAELEYKKLIANKEKIYWYRLFGGPSSIEQLANLLDRQALYEILYRQWSGPTHGTDILDGKLFHSKTGHGNAGIVQIRYAKSAQEVVQYTCHFLLMTYQLMTNNRIVSHKPDLSKWYSTVQKPYLEITEKKNLITIK